MTIEKRIKINNQIYFITVEVEYKKYNGKTTLCLKNFKNDYFDGGDLSLLIEKIENNYDKNSVKKYADGVSFMADCIYLYVRIPILSGIRNIYISNNENTPYSTSYIKKEEIEKYIKENNIKTENNNNFELNNENTWLI
ncbi:MAG TPA: hypothetical protein PLX66_01960 [Bacilli bacterium]|nr:hypothetical protein [Bacilli bacterium]